MALLSIRNVFKSYYLHGKRIDVLLRLPAASAGNGHYAVERIVVNGKPALEWVMERQCVKTDTASRIVSDANAFANETAADPAYPFKLFCRVITVSLRTMEIVRSLPPLDIMRGADAGEPGSGRTDAAADEELEAADAAE